MDINQFLNVVKNVTTKLPQSYIPGYGIGQTIRGAIALPGQKKEQEARSAQAQEEINKRLQDEALMRKSGIKPDYAITQQLYEQKAAREKQFAEDIQTVQGGGIASILATALALATPKINAPTLRSFPHGQFTRWRTQSLLENILSNLTGK